MKFCYIWPNLVRGVIKGAGRGGTAPYQKNTILVSFPMFLGTENSFLIFKIWLEEYLSKSKLGALTKGAGQGGVPRPNQKYNIGVFY